MAAPCHAPDAIPAPLSQPDYSTLPRTPPTVSRPARLPTSPSPYPPSPYPPSPCPQSPHVQSPHPQPEIRRACQCVPGDATGPVLMLRQPKSSGKASRCATGAVQKVLRCSANFGLGPWGGEQARVGPKGRWTDSGSVTQPAATPPAATQPIATPPAATPPATQKSQSMSMCP